MTEFCEANDGSDGIARQRFENRSELPAVRSNRDPARVVAEIRQAAQNRFWEAKHRDAIRLALTDALLHVADRFHRVLGEQWCLVGGNLHRSRIKRASDRRLRETAVSARRTDQNTIGVLIVRPGTTHIRKRFAGIFLGVAQ
jgi:hypothetical protein